MNDKNHNIEFLHLKARLEEHESLPGLLKISLLALSENPLHISSIALLWKNSLTKRVETLLTICLPRV